METRNILRVLFNIITHIFWGSGSVRKSGRLVICWSGVQFPPAPYLVRWQSGRLCRTAKQSNEGSYLIFICEILCGLALLWADIRWLFESRRFKSCPYRLGGCHSVVWSSIQLCHGCDSGSNPDDTV